MKNYLIYSKLIGKDGKEISTEQQLNLHTDSDTSTGTELSSGVLINSEAYATFFSDYINQSEIGTNPIVAFRFNKSILQLLLAFENCHSIVFCKSLRPDPVDSIKKIETIVAVALDKSNFPLGWSDFSKPVDPTNFIAAEWIHGVTISQAKGHIIPNIEGVNGFDFKAFFKSL